MTIACAALQIGAGLLVWALHFAVLYGFAALACARGMTAALPWVIGVATVIAAALCLYLIGRARRRTGFEQWLGGAAAALALLAVLWQALPALLVTPPCA